ncbi:unnamed protein product [Musa hybrid cultivar]
MVGHQRKLFGVPSLQHMVVHQRATMTASCFREASLSSGPYITLPSLPSRRTSQDPYKPSSITIILDWTRISQEEREREKESERMGSRSKASLVVAASLAAVEALKDQAGLCRWNYMLRSLHQRAKNSSGGTGQFPQAKLTIPSVEPWRRGGVGAVERAKRTEQSMGKVMYLECWGPK